MSAHVLRRIAREMKMPKAKRDIGAEILAGIRDLKAGRVGRVVNVPPATQVADAMTSEKSSIREDLRLEYLREGFSGGLARGKYAARMEPSAKAHGSAV